MRLLGNRIERLVRPSLGGRFWFRRHMNICSLNFELIGTPVCVRQMRQRGVCTADATRRLQPKGKEKVAKYE